MQVGFGIELARAPSYPVMCQFPLFVALCDHNPPTLQTDWQTNWQTDVMLTANQSSESALDSRDEMYAGCVGTLYTPSTKDFRVLGPIVV